MKGRRFHMYTMPSIHRIVVKVGTSTLTHGTGLLNLHRIEELVRILSDIKNSGIDVILVTSGAIGVGMSKLGMTVRPSELPVKQAAAAVGQCELMQLYDKFFREYGQNVGQILITRDDVEQPDRKENIINTFNTLLQLGVIPIVNENDSIAVEEILFGDNDSLSAVVAVLSEANLLVLLTDIDGLYDCNPRENDEARIIPRVCEITEDIKCAAGGAGSELGTGGMVTKIAAAEICLKNNIPMIITNGSRPQDLYDIISCRICGTLFMK